ncbi:MAG: hypothetical protein HY245_10150 [Rhizobiales bacterium]|nr:hypothetical protein [Hyphomicrobiales bacterium]MBI3673762.1 hypothetical protein [Hyphomicrobiales bacterium]
MTEVPRNPHLVLAAALLLPGSGHVLLGLPTRGLIFLFFMVVLGVASLNLMPADSNFIVRHIGGIFVYGLSVIDAYKIARIRFETWRHGATANKDSSVK